jgi:hypothetical protein
MGYAVGQGLMLLTHSQIESAAPDQAALKAAAGLSKPSHWSGLGRSGDGVLVWGECQGSGANPYRVVVDVTDTGSKCTCPSRKFPCKHGLALMWLCVDGGALPVTGAPPWVTEWVGRRRKTPASSAPRAAGAATSLAEASRAESEAPPDAAAEARRAAAATKRAAETRASVLAATEELDRWTADQLRTGLISFLAEAGERCRRIAARLVDGKAAALASRLDELPGRLLALTAPERPDAALVELGKLVLLCRAWRTAPEDPELRREVVTTESRDELLANPDAPRCASLWEVVGEQVATRRDGLVGVSTWLLNLREAGPRFALLLDFFPASAGRRSAAFATGEQFEGTLAFYPSRAPVRAVIVARGEALPRPMPWPTPADGDPLAPFAERLLAAPWTLQTPLLLPAGCIATERSGAPWWQGEGLALPLDGAPRAPVIGSALHATFGLWAGARLTLLASQSDWGRLDLA